jgi:hypothetical protein
LRGKRSVLLSLALIVGSFFILTAERIFHYAAAPLKDKESDFVFPADPDQQNSTVLNSNIKPSLITFKQRGGFANDASHLNKTPVYGIVKIENEQDVRNALQFARDNKLKVTCLGQQHSMGGQTFTSRGLLLDFRDFNRITLDKAHKKVNVQAGVRWWQLQQLLDGEGLSVKSNRSTSSASGDRLV